MCHEMFDLQLKAPVLKFYIELYFNVCASFEGLCFCNKTNKQIFMKISVSLNPIQEM